jgi:hypothetical protein
VAIAIGAREGCKGKTANLNNISPTAASRRAISFTIAALAALAVPQAALADTAVLPGAETPRTTVYEAAYFTQFAPSNALDIVRRVPGFALEETDEEVRGFSGTAGNVVLNGARPASKSETLQAMLTKIPARRVLRVEVASGDVYGSDYAGKAQVLNVVMSREGGVDGNVKASIARAHEGSVWPNLEASALIRTGTSSFNLSAGTGRNRQVEVGFDDLRRLSDGSQLERRDKVNTIDFYNPFASASWSNEGGTNKSAHINLRYAPSRFKLGQTNHVTPTGAAERDDRLSQNYRNTGYELGGDVTRPLGGGAIKFVALANRRERDNFDDYLFREGGETTGGFEQFQDARYDEVLGRLSWSHPKLAGFTAEFGNELAYNRLENATELFLIGPGGVRTRIDLPIDRAVVDELRTETYVNFGRPLTSTLRLDAALAFETSKLTVSGDTGSERALRFLKPSLTLDWKGAKGWHVQAVARREVAQLDFYDFISSAELANDRVNGGNADLVPQRSWEARLTVERPILGRGLAKLELGYDRVSQLQDRILTEEGFDAPGNIGSGSRKFARATFDAPLDTLGLKATQIRFDVTFQETRVRDPLSDVVRRWNGFWPEWNYELELRRDLAKWSYGATLFDRAPFANFRNDEIDNFFNSQPYATAFVEFRPDKRTTMRFDFENLIDTRGERFREFFDPNRSVPTAAVTEFRRRNQHVGVKFSINRTFGGSG